MNAVDTQESGDVPQGTVLEVYRSGYEWNGEVFRPAQVKVSVAAPGMSGRKK
jgi:molecular chaperone GrpE (heat shock protein)